MSKRGSGRSVNTVYTDNLERFEKRIVDMYDGSQHQDEYHLRARLMRHGLDADLAELVIDRMVKNKTFNEIAKDRGYSQPGAALTALNRAIAILKETGYGVPKGKK